MANIRLHSFSQLALQQLNFAGILLHKQRELLALSASRCYRYSTMPQLKPAAAAPSSKDAESATTSASDVDTTVSRVTGHETADKALHAISGGRINLWMQKYESLVGLAEVKEAQNNVIQAENEFRAMQSDRRGKQQQMTDIHSKLKDIHAAIDKVQRGDERYLALLTEEYEIIKQEKKLAMELARAEQFERDNFASLSSAVRESHEKERARAERTKYWSVIGSIIGAAIGIIGTSLNNYLRMRELKGLVKESTVSGVELKGVVGQLSDTMTSQYSQLQLFMSELKQLVGLPGSAASAAAVAPHISSRSKAIESSTEQLQAQTIEILGFVREQDRVISREMGEIKKLLAVQHSVSPSEGSSASTVVYVGPEMEALLSKTEESLEWKIKTHALLTAALLYSAGALTIYMIVKASGQ